MLMNYVFSVPVRQCLPFVPKRIQIKLVRVASSAHSFNLMRFAALVIIFSISTPSNYPIVVWSCD
jgi:hypothetical protein